MAGNEISDGDLLPEYNTTVSFESGAGVLANICRTTHSQDHLFGLAKSEGVSISTGATDIKGADGMAI